MCLAVPGQVLEIVDKKQAIVDFLGLRKKVAIDLLEHVKAGDFVIVHAGFAISILDEREALETLKAFRELPKDLR